MAPREVRYASPPQYRGAMEDQETLTADRAAARRLWPDLACETLAPLGDGWTCRTYEIDGSWIAQFPRTEYAEETLLSQRRVLPLLAQRLPVEIPTPVATAHERPVAMLYRKIEETPATATAQGSWPEQLGGMLRALQDIEPQSIGLRPRSSAALRAECGTQLDGFVEQVLPLLEVTERELFRNRFRDHLRDDANWRFTPTLAHGDLGPEHMLVTESGALAGVIDWEELAVQDPATDVAWLLHAWPPIGTRVAAQLKVETREALPRRTAFLYELMPFHEVIYGLGSDQPLFVESGLSGIRSRVGA